MSSKRRVGILAAVALTAAEAVVVGRRRGSFVDPRTIVRCRRGHTFTTLWVPGVSVKSVRLGWWRLQRCPVDHHFDLVTPVRVSALSQDQRAAAAATRDLWIP